MEEKDVAGRADGEPRRSQWKSPWGYPYSQVWLFLSRESGKGEGGGLDNSGRGCLLAVEFSLEARSAMSRDCSMSLTCWGGVGGKILVPGGDWGGGCQV